MRLFSLKSWFLVVAAVLVLPWNTGLAHAAGLGRLTILSALGQPLAAEIELVSVHRDEIPSLTARLASPDAFRAANITYSPALVGARLSIERRPNGQHYIRVSSTRIVNEPFLDLLVELTWASGRLVREYTVLIDPPVVASAPQTGAPAAVTPPRGAPLAPPVTVPAPAPEREPRAAPTPRERPQPKMAARPEAPAPAAAAASTGEYAVQKGDTLFKIAANTKPEGVTLEQMLAALYRNNPDAFQGNMNRLKTGRILKVPDAATATATPQPEAIKEIRVQTADWNAYRRKLADAPADATAADAKPAAGKITTATQDKGANEAPKDVVRLSKGEAPGAAGKPMSSRERLRMLEEETTAKGKALADANERIAQLEKSIGDMQKLLQLKGQPVPPAVKPDASKAAAPPPPPPVVAKAEPPKPEAKAAPVPAPVPAKPPEPAKAAPPADTKAAAAPTPAPAPAPTPAPTPAPDAKGAAPLEPPKPAPDAAPVAPEAAKATPAPKPKPKPVAPPPPPPPGLVDQVLDEPLYLAGGVGALLALLGGGFYALKRRRRSTDGPEVRKVAPKLGAAAGAAPASMQSTVIMPAQPSEPAAMSDADVYIDEADMFMKIGRDAQAEERLKEALEKEPGRQDAQLKLLEIYSVRKDKAGFEKVAQGLQQSTGGSGDNWMRAAALGYALDSSNALYAAGKDTHAAAPLATGSGGELDFDLDLDNKSVSETDVLLDTGDRQTANVIDPTKTMIVPQRSAAAAAAPAPSARPEPSNPMPDFTLDVAHGLGLNLKQPDITIDSLPASGKPEDTQTNLSANVTNVSSGPNIIDFSLDLPETASPAKEATRDGTLILTPENAQKASELTLDMDIGAKPPTETNAPLVPDFKLDLGETTAGLPPGATETVPDLDLGSLSFSMDDAGGAAPAGGDGTKDAHWYDVQTKFDLAKAYQEMGDKDGAREILQEVMKEGDAAQQAEAKQLLDSLA